MKSKRTRQFHVLFAELPEQVQRQANAAYQLFRENPSTAKREQACHAHSPVITTILNTQLTSHRRSSRIPPDSHTHRGIARLDDESCY